ncbi:MAG TPA: AraC family transcriptional regulator [Rectinemataceae bacterium]|nr:AraC family transcriptional regulator [Rectinemataceae bacterium]
MLNTGSARDMGFIRYLAWSEEDERWRLVCTDAGCSEIAPGVVYPPNKEEHPGPFVSVAVGRTLNEYQLIYVTHGSGIFETEGRRYDVRPGSAIMIFPGVKHFYRPDIDVGWTEYWVGFKGDQIDSLYREGFLSPSRPFFSPGLRDGILAHYKQIFDLVAGQEPLYQPKAAALILGLVAELLSCERKSVQPGHAEELVARAKFLMQERVDGEIDLNAISNELGVSTSHLNEAFKSYTSMTPYQYFISVKLGRAKELLERGLPVKQVAWDLGFQDEYYFSRLFKNKTGISPSHWKPWDHA